MSTYVWLRVIAKFIAGGDFLVLRKVSVKNKLLLLSLSFAILLLSFCSWADRKDYPIKSDLHPKAKNIIFMVADGMGLAHVTAARIFKNGPDGESLYLETLPTIGYQRTHSASDSLTDSAAAASAWASGEKFNNGEISCHDDDQDGRCEPAPDPTILEIAKAKGKATGLVVTSTVTHATPGAFGAHVASRRCERPLTCPVPAIVLLRPFRLLRPGFGAAPSATEPRGPPLPAQESALRGLSPVFGWTFP